MNDYVNDFYTACELVDDDLELLAQIMALVRDKTDKTRPNIIEHYCDECKFDLLHKYTSKICDMPYRDFTHIKNKAKNKLLEKKQEQIDLFDFYNIIIDYSNQQVIKKIKPKKKKPNNNFTQIDIYMILKE